MAKPVTGLIPFGSSPGPDNTGNLDTNYNLLAAALNDLGTYSNFLTDGSGAANSIVCALPAGLTASLVAGLRVDVKVANTNTGNVFLAIGVLTNTAVLNPDGTQLTPGQIKAGGVYLFEFDGVSFQLLSAANVDLRYVNIVSFGADPTGTADSTTAIQNAINSGALAVYVPPGTYKFSALVMPSTAYFVLFGVGTASVLKQTGTGITWPTTGTSPSAYNNQYIRDLHFIATTGTGHVINTQYQGGVTLLNLFCGDLPVGFDFIHIDGNAASTGDKYSHDVRCSNIQVYTTTAGHAGIGLGPNASDVSLDRFIMNGTGVAQYCGYAANGATSYTLANSHPYNAATNIWYHQGGASIALGLTFVNVIFDNVLGGAGDNVYMSDCRTPEWTACWFQQVHAGRNAITLNNIVAGCFTNCRFDASGPGASYIINETGTTDNTEVIGGDSPTNSSFINPVVNFIGPHSLIKNFVAYNAWGQQMAYTGSTSGPVATNSTVFLGANGAQGAINQTAFMVNLNSGENVARADIAWDIAPGVGQTYTFTLLLNGVTVTAAAGSANPQVVTGAAVFNTSIIVAQGANAFLAQFQQMVIKMVSSNGAGAPSVRYAITSMG